MIKTPDYTKIINSREDGSDKYDDSRIERMIKRRINLINDKIKCEVFIENGIFYFGDYKILENDDEDVKNVMNQILYLRQIVDSM